jgi:hypothetical protein
MNFKNQENLIGYIKDNEIKYIVGGKRMRFGHAESNSNTAKSILFTKDNSYFITFNDKGIVSTNRKLKKK